MIFAIYKGGVYCIGDNLNACELLDRATGTLVHVVDFGELELLVDPTDDQINAAEHGLPLPMEQEGYDR